VQKTFRKKIARERINRLFQEAEKRAMEGKIELANRYVELARKIAMKYLVRIPKIYRMRFCRKCNSYLIPGKNCRVRIHKHRIIITCDKCGNIKRYPYLSEIKMKRRSRFE